MRRSAPPDMGQQNVIEMAYASRPRHLSETRREYLNALYDVASWENRAKVLQVRFDDVGTDAQLFDRISREVAKTQYFFRSRGENIKWYNTLAWLHWYHVQRIDYVQVLLVIRTAPDAKLIAHIVHTPLALHPKCHSFSNLHHGPLPP